MPAITSLGIGSGIDLNAMVTQLVAVERQPLKKMQQAASAMQTQLSALGRMQSLLSALQDAGDVLSKPTLWSGSTPSSSDAATVSASGTSAPVGSYAVAVQSLASGQTVASTSAFASAPWNWNRVTRAWPWPRRRRSKPTRRNRCSWPT